MRDFPEIYQIWMFLNWTYIIFVLLTLVVDPKTNGDTFGVVCRNFVRQEKESLLYRNSKTIWKKMGVVKFEKKWYFKINKKNYQFKQKTVLYQIL